MRNLILFTAILTAFCSYAQINTAKLDSLFNKIESQDAGMGSVSIFEEGKQVYSKSIGYRNKELELKSNDQTKHRIGSLSKTYTAAVILKLVESGDLKLETKLKKFFPEIPNAKKITIEDLLRHTSGVFNFTNEPAYFSYNHKEISRKDLVAKIASYDAQFKPGSKFQYSNSNFVLLTFIAEDLAGKDMSVLIKEYITEPLGLNRTSYGGVTDSTNNEAFSYNDFGGWEREKITHMSVPEGAGGVAASTNNVSVFLNALFTGEILDDKTLKLMLDFQGKMNYGLGVYQSSLGDGTWIGHNGGVDGFQTSGFYHPETKRTLIYVSNGTVFPITNIVTGIIKVLNNDSYNIPVIPKRGELTDVDLKSYEGTYVLDGFPLKINITYNDEVLIGQATGQGSFPLTQVGTGKFEYEPAGIRMLFESNTDKMVLIQQGVRIDFLKEGQEEK